MWPFVRPDQLGDMVISVPALLRLREILPDARITGLLGPANAPLARSLGIFDEIIVLDFPDDPHQRQRIMDRKGQEELARKLAPYKFDVAIELPHRRGVAQATAPDRRPDLIGYGGERQSLNLNMSTAGPEDRERHDAALGQDAGPGRDPCLVAGQRRQGRPPEGSQSQPADALRPRRGRGLHRPA